MTWKSDHRAWFTGVRFFKPVLFPFIPAGKTYSSENNLAFEVLLIFGHALGRSKTSGHKWGEKFTQASPHKVSTTTIKVTKYYIQEALLSLIFRCIIPTVLQAIREGVGYVKTQLSCILFIVLMTTCFGHCGPSWGHKKVYRGNYTEYDHSIL